MIAENLKLVRSRVEEIKYKNGIERDVTIIAVSKGHSAASVIEAYEAGQLVFGESRVQEALVKLEGVPYDDIEWHFIGNLQRNKVKKALELFNVIHSVSSLRTALELDKQSRILGRVLDIFVQVNTTGEGQKLGVSVEELPYLLEGIIVLRGIRVIGLMTISQLTDDSLLIRRSFSLLRELRDSMRRRFSSGLSLEYLSMGMSGDYELALLEGASHLRIGSFIFGERRYVKA